MLGPVITEGLMHFAEMAGKVMDRSLGLMNQIRAFCVALMLLAEPLEQSMRSKRQIVATNSWQIATRKLFLPSLASRKA